MSKLNQKIIVAVVALFALYQIFLPLRASVLHAEGRSIVRAVISKKGLDEKNARAGYNAAIEKLKKSEGLYSLAKNLYSDLCLGYVMTGDNEKVVQTANKGQTRGMRFLLYSVAGTAKLKSGELFSAKRYYDLCLNYSPEFEEALNNSSLAVMRILSQEKKAKNKN